MKTEATNTETTTKPTILIVDDTVFNIELLDTVLSSTYLIKAALNGEKAIEIARTIPQPHMILLDIMMPDMDGYEVINRLKSDISTAHIPVIFITGSTDPDAEKRGLNLGAIDYISKPISPPIVKARVKNHLALYHQNKELERKVEERTRQLNAKVEERSQVLHSTMQQLADAEKMAALSQLISGVAHEINTPIGNCLTSASLLQDLTKALCEQHQSNSLSKSNLENYLLQSTDISALIQQNIRRTAELIERFKSTAVRSSEEERYNFNLKSHLKLVISSLSAELNEGEHSATVVCDSDFELNSFPSAFTLIFNNLLMNSIVHGFRGRMGGKITITVERQVNGLTLRYEDDGLGIPANSQKKIFEPFYTIRRSESAGLGLYIVYNTIVQQLKGEVHCSSDSHRGVRFLMSLPHSDVG